jgi:hypothetical protein
MLEQQAAWLRRNIDSFRNSNMPPSWIADSVRRTEIHIDNIEWRLSFEPPHPAPICGWKKPYRDHSWPCTDSKCAAQMGLKPKRNPKRFSEEPINET